MHVDSYLEIYTTMYGWAFANIISSVIIGTGLVVVPFFVIIFKKWMDAKEQGMQAGGIMSLLESAQARLIVALFVATTCFFSSSTTSLSSIDLVHQPRATVLEPNPQEVSRDKGTNSAMDTGMADAQKGKIAQVGNGVDGLDRVPLWWYSVMAMSSGINNAVRGGLSNFENPMREIQTLAQLLVLEDDKLKMKSTAFYEQCFKKARARLREVGEDSLSAKAKEIREKKKDDVAWMGSMIYLDEPGFYDKPVERLEDFGIKPDNTTVKGAGNQVLGNPTCKEIWEGYGSQKGLLDELASHTKSGTRATSQAMNAWQWIENNVVASAAGMLFGRTTERAVKDHVVRGMLSRTSFVDMVPDGQVADYGGMRNAENSFWQTINGMIGVNVQAMKGDMWRQPLLTGLPMAQALLLMGIYTFLPLAMFLSGYDLRAMFIGTVALFTVKMFASMWTIAQWIDAKLVVSMYPNMLEQTFKMIEGAAPMLDNYKANILNTLLVGMLVGLPLLWVSMMGWFGVRLSAATFALMAAAEGTAKKSADTTAAAASFAAKKAIPPIGKK